MTYFHFSEFALGSSVEFARHITKNGKRFLCQNNYRYYKNGDIALANGGQRIYWRCAKYKQFACNARASTEVIGGS